MPLLAQSRPAAAPRKPAKPSQTKPVAAKPAPSTFLIRTLRVEGTNQLPPEGVMAAAALKIGMMANREAFEVAREKLLATGLFEEAGYRYNPAPDKAPAVDAVLIVREIPFLYPFRFEELPGEALTAALKSADPLYSGRLSATPVALKRYAAILSEAQKSGVVGKVLAEGPNQFVILFRPDVPEPTISQVTFRGNEVIPTAMLLTTINSSAIGAIYKEDRMREYLDNAIRPLYEERGRLQLQFPKITAKPSEENKGLDVTVEMVEGPSFELGDITVQAGDETGRLQRAVALSSGDLANMKSVEEARDRVRLALRKSGYLKHEVRVERKLAPGAKVGDKNLVHLTMHVAPGPKYTFQALRIEGLDILNEPPLRKMWSLEPGADFNAEYPDFFLKTIRDEGLFDDLGTTRAKVELDDAKHEATVTLVFGKAERKPPAKKQERPLF